MVPAPISPKVRGPSLPRGRSDVRQERRSLSPETELSTSFATPWQTDREIGAAEGRCAR
jgi:hypothetical protein